MTDSRLLRSFIPPYILNRIIAHGSEPQRTAAMRTLNHVRNLLPNPGAPSRPVRGCPVVPEPGWSGAGSRTVAASSSGQGLG